ncbi:hypothetical protein Kpol_1004p39 [Vanderwaltozyma polyspora DSM 70294]|uniref:EamA domain-containing protein n=1 Tax=Vanderwaltozyma polyspora (strain ATCC 22028 / DSM 70294 / BCRC 21397 / CBS 2163 / NBRC 10782 / NRRL Y-8283 / UCD 57-17) TaxID=436907 RepID=A7TJ95_VANPO|nr:uncharacterized protein Kpol_1004p39 [Vanderwaltozyma polyspora DSM 70294]EDO17664.1 hypothetical protein Kpol_1004p39 [Vanderwaltozyma polyspora DSM 70294]
MMLDVQKRWSWGLILLGIVVILWVLSSFLINIIFKDNLYRKPFFITYINTVSFIFYLVPLLFTFTKNLIRNGCSNPIQNLHEELVIAQEGHHEVDDEEETDPLLINRTKSNKSQNERLSLNETIWLSLQFCSLWFLANLVTNASLAYTSVASQTILSSTSSFFTLFIGAIWKVESVTKSKLLGSLISFIGILFVTHSDYYNYDYPPITKPHSLASLFDGDSNSPFKIVFGNILALSGALLYSVYSILLKHKVQDETRLNMHIFFGFVGFFTLVLFWPIMLLLQYYNWETFELPSSKKVTIIIILNCLITFISDYCWANAMLLTTPFIVTVGLSVTIPLAMLGDFIFVDRSMTLIYVVGAALIMGSFLIINTDSEQEQIENQLQIQIQEEQI